MQPLAKVEPDDDLKNPITQGVLASSGNAISSPVGDPYLRMSPKLEWPPDIPISAYRTYGYRPNSEETTSLARVPRKSRIARNKTDGSRRIQIRTKLPFGKASDRYPEDLERVEKFFDQKNKNATLAKFSKQEQEQCL